MFSVDLGEAPGLLAGDVLFAGSVGRVDLPGGSWDAMLALAARRRPAAGRRDGRAARPRPGDDDRPGAGDQPVPGRGGGGRGRGAEGARAVSDLRAPKGTFDVLPPDSARFLAVRDTLTAPLRRAGYGYVETPIFEDTAVFSRGVGESTDVVIEGDVHLRGPRRPLADPAPGAHRRADARLHRAPAARRRAAGEALDGRHGAPLRAPAGRPLPALHAGRHGGARRRRPGAGRRGGGAGRAGLPRPRADRLRAAADLAGRRAPAARSTASCWCSTSRSSTSTRTPGAAPRSTRCGCSTTSAPRCRPSSDDAPLMVDHLSDSTKAHYDAVRQHLTDLGRDLDRGAQAGARPGLLHEDDVRVRAPRARRAVGDRRRRAVRRPLRGPRRPRRLRHRLRRRVDRTLLAVQAEGLDIGATRRGAGVRRPAGAEAKRLAVRLVGQLRRGRRRRRHRVRRPRAQGRDEGRRPVGRLARRRHRRPRPGRGRGPAQGHAHRRAAPPSRSASCSRRLRDRWGQ